jgi:hypothetical protein
MSSKNCWRLYNSYRTQPGGIGAPCALGVDNICIV